MHAEIVDAILAIELADKKGWKNLWLECVIQFFFGVQAFSNSSLIPWPLKNRWYNCIDIAKNMNFIVDYIYKEDNSFVSAELNKNWTGLPNY